MSSIPNNPNYPKFEMGKNGIKVQNDILELFKYRCKAANIQMNVVLETFMRQYIDGDFVAVYDQNGEVIIYPNNKDVFKTTTFPVFPEEFVDIEPEPDETLTSFGTTVTMNVYKRFKAKCKAEKVSINAVTVAFMNFFSEGNCFLRFSINTPTKGRKK